MSTLVYLQRGDETLMLLRGKKKQDVHQGKWNGLGGKMEASESPEECAVREVYEESGLQVKKLQIAGLMTFPNFADGLDWFIYVYTCRDFEGEMLSESDEGELHWIKTDRILDLNLWEGDRLFIKWILDGKFFSAKFLYDGEKLKDHSVAFYSF